MASRRARVGHGETTWPQDCHTGIEAVVAEFRERLPGWWYSLGECQVSCDASCSPTRHSPDIELIDVDGRFDSGFHADLAQPSTLADALRTVMEEAIEAIAVARSERLVSLEEQSETHAHIAAYDRDAARLAPLYDELDTTEFHRLVLEARGRGRRRAALDVGAGSGRDARWLASLGYRVNAAEPATAMRTIGAGHPDNGSIQWTDTRLPDLRQIEHRTQDLVLVSAVWQHVPPERRDRAFDRLVDTLRPGGLLAVLTRHGPAPEGRPMYDIPPDDMANHAERQGMTDVTSHPMTDVQGRSDVSWVLWTMRRPRRDR